MQSHPGGLLFTKFGSNQTALLDLAFPVMVIPPISFILFIWTSHSSFLEMRQVQLSWFCSLSLNFKAFLWVFDILCIHSIYEVSQM